MSTELKLKLKEGEKAPDFELKSSHGGTVSLRSLRGKRVVLYFYPKDDTPGCAKEACGFRDHSGEFKSRGAVVLGVSTDPLEKHKKFSEKFNLPFPLLSDTEREVANAYGVWGQKSFMGRKYMGIHRVTFLIGPDGTIKRIWPKVKPGQHAMEVLNALGEG